MKNFISKVQIIKLTVSVPRYINFEVNPRPNLIHLEIPISFYVIHIIHIIYIYIMHTKHIIHIIHIIQI